MRAASLALLLAAAAGTVAADDARIALPASLVGSVAGGRRCGLALSVETAADATVVTVHQRVAALPPAPGYPLRDARRCPDPDALVAPRLHALPPELVGAARTASSSYDLVAEVVAWVSEHVVFDEDDGGEQDAVSVLRRRRGRCSGRANLAVGLLRVLGIPARSVHGLVAGDDAVRWHRWGEAWLGDVGWVPFDPGASVGLVRVRYVPTATRARAELDGARLERVSEPGFAAVPRWRGLRRRPVGGATLRCSSGGGRITATLVGPDGLPTVREGAGELEFARLIAGRYRLSWRSAGRAGGPVALAVTEERMLHLALDGLTGSGR